MKGKSVAVAVLSLAGAVVLAACGTVRVDTTPFVNSVNQQFRAELGKALEIASTGAGVELQCPKMVDEGARFQCKVIGKLSGDTKTVELTTKATGDSNKDDVLPVSKADLTRAFASVAGAEGKAAGEKIISGG